MTEALWLQLGVAGAAIFAMVVLVKAVLNHSRLTQRHIAEMQARYVDSLQAVTRAFYEGLDRMEDAVVRAIRETAPENPEVTP